MVVKIIVGLMAGILGLFGTVWGSVTVLDGRYEQKIVHTPVHMQITQGMNSYAYTALKKEIREIRTQLLNATGAWKQQLEYDLIDALDRLCLQFPNDRECG
jgi:hypothetical protein